MIGRAPRAARIVAERLARGRGERVTTAHDSERGIAQRDESRRRRWLPGRAARRAIAAVVAAVVLAAGGGWLAYADHYQPLGPGGFGGASTSAVKQVTDGIGDTGFLLIGAKGTRGAIEYSLANTGGHPVRVLGLVPDSSGRLSMRWAPLVMKDGPIGGTPAEARPFPATVPPGHEIALWVTATKPTCGDGVVEIRTELPIRWSALGFHHVYRMPLEPEVTGNGTLPIALCYPAAALRHVDRK
jgi:hypothetical protein